MENKGRDKYLSTTERTRFDALAESDTVKQAAGKLGITESSMNNWTAKKRKQIMRERGHVNACLAQQQRSSLLKKILSVKKPIKKPKEIELDEPSF